MTIRKLTSLVLILFICSCQNKTSEKNVDSDNLFIKDTVTYLSSENDLALIKLTLIPNGTFDFYMSIFPEPLQNEKPEPDIINASGLWNGDEHTLSLNFVKREKDTLDLNALFDSKYQQGNEFEVTDQNTVEINYKLDKLNIWGIECYKTEK